jgi:lysyl-tRNA synthetase class II
MSERDENDLVRQRREKLEALRARGVEPFGTRFPVTHWAQALAERLGTASEDELKAFGPVSLAGRLVAMRDHGKTAFAHLMDRTGRIQLYARGDQLGDDYASFTALDVGDFIGVTGEMFRTRTGQLTVAVKSLTFRRSRCGRCPRSGTGSRTWRRGTGSDTWTSWSTRRSARSSCCAAASSPPCAPSWTRADSWRSRRR